ncbi:MAG: Phenylacetic acid catabolic protein [bacterium]
MPRIQTFDDWIDLFREWQNDIGLDRELIKEYEFSSQFGKLETDEIEFGDYRGDRKWEKVRDIPEQRIQDALLNLIVYQGDTEFASVEQQRLLVNTAPNEHDLRSLCRVMCEEMRHGWQMSTLLIEHFGYSGRVEALKLLERRAFENKRLLGSFNEEVENYLDFFVYTQFIDRDGKYQLKMLSRSSFAPLARSMRPMLVEEAFHLGTGNDGLLRTVKAGVLPIKYIQKYFNKWVPTAYDLFGTDHSSSAHWAYVWGLKGRFDEGENSKPADKGSLNEYARTLYFAEVQALCDRLNKHVREEDERLYMPDVKFNRSIGQYAGKCFTVTGQEMDAAKYDEYVKEVLPTDEDRADVHRILKDKNWILPKKLEVQ